VVTSGMMLKVHECWSDTLTDVKPGEQVLIVLDTATSQRIAEMAAQAVRERQATPVIAVIDPLPLPNAEPQRRWRRPWARQM